MLTRTRSKAKDENEPQKQFKNFSNLTFNGMNDFNLNKQDSDISF